MGRIGRLIKTEIEKFIVQTVESYLGKNQLCKQYGASGDESLSKKLTALEKKRKEALLAGKDHWRRDSLPMMDWKWRTMLG